VNDTSVNYLSGELPLFDVHGEVVGSSSLMVSTEVFQNMVQNIMQKSGQVAKGWYAAVYTSEGKIFGVSEQVYLEHGETLMVLEDVPAHLETAWAINAVHEAFGDACPEDPKTLFRDERVVDVRLFHAAEWGVPRFDFRICLLITLPASNFYSNVDLEERSLEVGVAAGSGSVVALGFVMVAMSLAIRGHREEFAERETLHRSRVAEAELNLTSFAQPMALMLASDFLSLTAMVCHEDCRDRGLLVFLDSMEQVETFKRSRSIAFISHQWLGGADPDTEDTTQLRVMQGAVRGLMVTTSREMHVWMDYISVPQRHAGAQAMAMWALPAYVSTADHFIICAPDAVHRDTQEPCGLDTYTCRGWCRLEMMARACSSGVEQVYLQTEAADDLRAMTAADFQTLSLRVFEGHFSVQSDVQKLVDPVLGLYCSILRQGHEGDVEHIHALRKQIESDRFLAPTNGLHSSSWVETCELFRHLLQVVQDHVTQTPSVCRHILSVVEPDAESRNLMPVVVAETCDVEWPRDTGNGPLQLGPDVGVAEEDTQPHTSRELDDDSAQVRNVELTMQGGEPCATLNSCSNLLCCVCCETSSCQETERDSLAAFPVLQFGNQSFLDDPNVAPE